MKVEISVDKSYKEPHIVIFTNEITGEITRLANRLSQSGLAAVNGYKDDRVEIIPTCNIIRIYAENQRVFAQTAGGVYVMHHRLYELESQLDGTRFLRISKSEIINVDFAHRLDASFSGTIEITLGQGIRSFVSRRYVKRIKEFFKQRGME